MVTTGETFLLQRCGFAAPEPSPTSRIGGELIDARFLIEAPIGEGSSGIVYRARELALDRAVALKLVTNKARDERMIDRLQKEARALARVRHDNVVQIHTMGQHETYEYIAMELVAGRNVASIIEEHALVGRTVPLASAIALIRGVTRGLSAVHERQLVHRDVKPSNIVVEERTNRPVLIDFGLARRLSGSSPRLSVMGGTPCYMAPEQARETSGVSARSDLYALACTAFEIFTGRPVFDEVDTSAMLRAHAKKMPPRISSLRPVLLPFDSIFKKALAKEPSDRYQSCAAFLAAFDAAARKVELRRSRPPPGGPPPPPRGGTRAFSSASSDMRCCRRVLTYQHADGLRRDVLQMLDLVLHTAGDTADVTCVHSERDFLQAFARQPADIVVIDDASALGRAEAIVEGVRTTPRGSTAEIVVLTTEASLPSTRLAQLEVRAIPKPVNMQVLRSVFMKMGVRIAERRFHRLHAETMEQQQEQQHGES